MSPGLETFFQWLEIAKLVAYGFIFEIAFSPSYTSFFFYEKSANIATFHQIYSLVIQ